MGNSDSKNQETKTAKSNISRTSTTNVIIHKTHSPISSPSGQIKSTANLPQSTSLQSPVAGSIGASPTSQFKSLSMAYSGPQTQPAISPQSIPTIANNTQSNQLKSTPSLLTKPQWLPKSPTTAPLPETKKSPNFTLVTPVVPAKNAEEQDTMSTELSLDEQKILKAKKPLIRHYSTGLTFVRRADVKRITCDQLNPLDTHKDRFPVNRERRNWVIKKLYTIGGWIRKEGRHKEERFYVAPNSPLPSNMLIKKSRTKVEVSEWSFFDDLSF